jgi:hypothetical protein
MFILVLWRTLTQQTKLIKRKGEDKNYHYQERNKDYYYKLELKG